MKRISVGLAENNDNGQPEGFVHQIDFTFEGEYLLRLETDLCDPEKVKTHELGDIEMYGQKFETSHRREWAGNMMWNEYEISRHEAARFINALMASGYWSVTEGDSELFEAYEAKREILINDLDVAIGVLAK